MLLCEFALFDSWPLYPLLAHRFFRLIDACEALFAKRPASCRDLVVVHANDFLLSAVSLETLFFRDVILLKRLLDRVIFFSKVHRSVLVVKKVFSCLLQIYFFGVLFLFKCIAVARKWLSPSFESKK